RRPRPRQHRADNARRSPALAAPAVTRLAWPASDGTGVPARTWAGRQRCSAQRRQRFGSYKHAAQCAEPDPALVTGINSGEAIANVELRTSPGAGRRCSIRGAVPAPLAVEGDEIVLHLRGQVIG